MDCFGQTDPGKAHLINEDQFLLADLQKSMLLFQTSLPHEDHARIFGRSQGQLLLVADGKGGIGFGDKASRIAIETIARYVLNTMRWFFQLSEDHEEDLRDQLAEALGRCRSQLQEAASRQNERHGMATTLTAAYVLWPRLYVIQAGNSRCYLYRNAALQAISGAGSGAETLRGSTLPSPGAVPVVVHPQSPADSMGSGEEAHPEIHQKILHIGDTLLLCTDGLTSMVNEGEILDILSLNLPAEQTCRKLIERANTAGGKDNVTVVIARIAGPGTTIHQPGLHAEAALPTSVGDAASLEKTSRAVY